MGEIIFFIGQLVIILYSIILHEVSHGAAAYYLGDHTALRAGRLTLNPIPHIDPIGTVLLPLLMAALPGGVIFGWAKPVPYNPYNLRGSFDEVKVALAGPATNILIAILFAALVRLMSAGFISLSALVGDLLVIGVYINILLAVFNLVPIPPLDGSKLLYLVVPKENYQLREFLNQYGMIILVFFIFFGFRMIFPLVDGAVKLLLGF